MYTNFDFEKQVTTNMVKYNNKKCIKFGNYFSDVCWYVRINGFAVWK